jgi:hypothetical protein
MTSSDLPELVVDFGLIPIPEQIAWRDALSHSILNQMDMPNWKKEEQIPVMNFTIACVADAGLTDPKSISEHILTTTKRNSDASSR